MLAESAGFLKYMKNTKLLPDIDAVLNGAFLQSNAPFLAPIDVYYLLVQNFVHAVGSELKTRGDKWQRYTDNSVDFISSIGNFPLELKKSYVDQLCQLDEVMSKGELITKYIYNDSCSRQVSKLIQELDYIK